MSRVRAVRWGRSWRIASAVTEVPAGDEVLLPEELALVDGAGAARRAEFATGRQCARLALEALGIPAPDAVPILRDRRGAPLWPDGVVGSITHCAGWTGAVVARARRVPALGLDAEPLAPLPAGVLEVVACGAERAVVDRLGGEHPGIPWDTLLFVAKEATYKAWYPLTGVVVGHDAVRVDLSPAGAFTAVARAEGSSGRTTVHRVRGRWAVGPRVVTALAVPG